MIALLIVLVGLSTATMAQNKPAAKEAKPAKEAAKATKAAKPAPAATPAAAPAGKLKADGTPDKRYKENKDAAKPAAGPLKKDGTPDMRPI